ncbi:MAG TPA: DUF488 domain-containing protein [Methyloceanibacter sp.]|nr:DUF488 domain-containing protein [Methyloceanibacter sp.]
MSKQAPAIFTIGHSNHPIGRFIALLADAGVTAVADVRSAPVSRFSPQFNRKALSASLGEHGIAYTFLGEELGGRPQHPEMFMGGVADYEKMAATESFRDGLNRLIDGARRYRIAAMCSEADPLDCHRCLLVARAMTERGLGVAHILASGDTVTHAEIEARLLDLAHLSEAGLLLESRDERLAEAYRARGRKIAYAPKVSAPRGGAARRD